MAYTLRTVLTTWTVVLLLSSGVFGAKSCMNKNKSLVVALLALHSGDHCEVVNQRALQQMAALNLTRDVLNAQRQDLPELDVKIYDTCSTVEKTQQSILRGLVLAQQGCDGPFFLGLLGPENTEEVAAVTKVTSIFGYPHVISSVVRGYGQYNIINVDVVEPKIRANAIQLLLNKLNWSSFYLAFTPDAASTQTVVNLVEERQFCVLKGLLRVPMNEAGDLAAYGRLVQALQNDKSSRLLLITGTSEAAISLLKHLRGDLQRTQIIVYMQGVGILPWTLDHGTANRTIILQEASSISILPPNFSNYLQNSTLWSDLTKQLPCGAECIEGPMVQDTSASALASALHLYQAALRTAKTSKKCTGPGICDKLVNIPASEWKRIVHETKTTIRDTYHGGPIRLHFHDMQKSLIHIFANEGEGQFKDVGVISDQHLTLTKFESLPFVTLDRDVQCSEEAMVLPTEIPPTEVPELPQPTSAGMPMDVEFLGMQINLGNFGFYELVGILTGILVVMVLIIISLICLVYRCFRVKPDKPFSSPSSTSLTSLKKESPKKEKRSFFRTSIRSVHTVKE